MLQNDQGTRGQDVSAGLGSRGTVFSALQWAAILDQLKRNRGLRKVMKAGKGKRYIRQKLKQGVRLRKSFLFVCIKKGNQVCTWYVHNLV